MRTIDAVVPARNEAATVGQVVQTLRAARAIDRVIVVDNDSADDTGTIARACGAEVVQCLTVGLGHAVKAGVAASSAPYLLRTDADIRNWNVDWVQQMSAASADIVRAYFESPYDNFPVTRLVAEPLWRLVFPGVEVPPRVLSGTYLVARHVLDLHRLSNDWSFDISLACLALEGGYSTAVVDIGTLTDRQRPLEHYVPMAHDIIKFMMRRKELGYVEPQD